MSYTYKRDKALDQTPSGNLEQYFDYISDTIQANDGRSDNKCLSIDAYDPPCPVAKGMYTKLKLTDESINVVNIDKSSITATVRITVNTTSDLTKEMYMNSASDTSGTDAVKAYLADMENLKYDTTKIFIGFKSAIHVLDAYRIYSNGKKTLCEQTEALFENAALRMIKSQEELDEKPNIYTTWEHAYNNDNCVCGVFVRLIDLMDTPSAGYTVDFEITIPIDEFLPFQAFTMYPNCIFGNLQIELKMAIQNNFVCCQVSTDKIVENYVRSAIKHGISVETLKPAMDFQNISEQIDSAMKKSFTQCGDSFNVVIVSNYHKSGSTWVPNVTITSSTTTADIFNAYTIQSYPITIEINTGTLMSCRTNLNGFNMKDSAIERLRSKFMSKPLIIPAQFVDYQAFSQPPMSFGLKCNTTYNLTNVSSILFLFPRTSHEITCSRNPFLASIQVQVDNKPYPDKPFSTNEAAHTMYNLTNLGYDELFSTSKEYSYSLIWNELDFPYKVGTTSIPVTESEDNTSYCFVCSTERLCGFGTFCDGLNKDNAHITLTGTLMSLPPGMQYHPYYQPEGLVNNRPPIMLICQDCFWKCVPGEGIEFVINDKTFYDRITQ